MAKYLHIEIPSACHENWDDMQDTGCGRYCGSCKKTVTDFSVMSDEQLAAFFSTKRENVCGRFYEDQLNRKIPVRGKTKHRQSVSFIAE